MPTTYTWTSGAVGDWDTATDWTAVPPGTIPFPGAADTANINGAGSSVASTLGTDQVDTLSVGSGAALTISSAFTLSPTLSANSGLTNAGTLNLAGATLNGDGGFTNSGTVAIQSGISEIKAATVGDRLFTNNKDLTLNASGDILIDRNSFQNTGTITVNGGYLGIDGRFYGDGGTVLIENHGHFGLGELGLGTNKISFGTGTTNVLDVDVAQQLQPQVFGMKAGDYIGLGNASPADIGQPTFSKGVLTYSDGKQIYSINLPDVADGTKFVAIKDQGTVNPGYAPGPNPTGNGVDLIIYAPATFENVPSTKYVPAGTSFSFASSKISDDFATTENDMVLTVSDATGTLSQNGNAKTGTSLTFTGTLDQINAALGTLSYTASAGGGPDTIDMLYKDGQNTLTSDEKIYINPAPGITAPATEQVAAGAAIPVSGISVGDAAAGTNPTMTLTVGDVSGKLAISNPGGGTVSGSGNAHTSLTITGTLDQINAALGTLSYVAPATPGNDTISLSYTDPTDHFSATKSIAVTVGTPGNPPPATATQNFAYTDTTTHTSGTSAGTAYSGPVSNITQQYIWSGSDNVALSANTGSVFMHGGPGDDALTAISGTNVLDGGAGSNFLVGAPGGDGGFDTFFDDGRGAQVTWDTLVNFHQGDAATIFGFTGGLSTMQWADNEGAAGYKGATLHSELGGAGTGINATITFAGLSLADAHAKLTISTGNVDGNAYLYLKYS